MWYAAEIQVTFLCCAQILEPQIGKWDCFARSWGCILWHYIIVSARFRQCRSKSSAWACYSFNGDLSSRTMLWGGNCKTGRWNRDTNVLQIKWHLTFDSLQEVCPEECETSVTRCQQHTNHSAEHSSTPQSENEIFYNKQSGCCDAKYHTGPATWNCLKMLYSDRIFESQKYLQIKCLLRTEF